MNWTEFWKATSLYDRDLRVRCQQSSACGDKGGGGGGGGEGARQLFPVLNHNQVEDARWDKCK